MSGEEKERTSTSVNRHTDYMEIYKRLRREVRALRGER